MSGGAGSFELLARMVGEALAPLQNRLAAGQAELLLLELGLRLPPGTAGQGGLPAALGTTAAAAGALPPKISALTGAISGGDGAAIAAAGLDLAASIRPVVDGIGQIASALDALAAGLGGLTPAEQARVRAFADELPKRLVNFLLLGWLDRFVPELPPSLALVGLADRIVEPGNPADPTAPPFARRALRLDRAGALLSDPVAHLRTLYGFGTPDFDGLELFRRIKSVVDRPDAEAALIQAPGQPAILDALVFRLAVDRPPGELPGLSFRLRTGAVADVPVTLPLAGPWSFVARTTSRFDAGLEAKIRPPGSLSLLPPTGSAQVAASAGLEASRAGAEIILFGQADSSRVSFRKAGGAIRVEASATAGVPGAIITPAVLAALEGGKVVIDTSKGDSFLSFLTGGIKGSADISLSATWSPAAGLKIDGSGAIEIAMPVHAKIGPIELNTIYLIGGLGPGGSIPLELSAAVRGSLGPLTASVDRVGVAANLTFPGEGGNFGPIDLDIGFKPPRGVGLVLDGGGFSGGGFLGLDPAKGEYFGMLELSFQGVVDVRAVGILNTKLPDGQDGFSLLILISAEFTPIQLSFGFTLLGVGGLVGINRTILFDVLRAGVRDGSLNSILFPREVVANASRIIGDLKRIFPPYDGHVLIGPMAKLGWGTPTIVSLELGLLLELPRPAFAIVGVLRIGLPTEDAAIIRIQVNFVGIVDFEKKQLSFDASLYDSYVLFMTLTGDMAVRVYWGDDANFLLSVGGFHPSYRPPPAMNLGNMQRLALVISQPMPLIRAEVYFAVTTNTVQFGAKIELLAGPGVFNIYGFLSLDALIQFDPFQFIVEIAGMLAVRSGSSVLFAVRLEMTLSGPKPWHAKGRASFEIGFIFTITISIGFDITVGDEAAGRMAAIKVLDLLLPALAADAAWRAVPAGEHSSQVTLRALPAGGPLVLNPAGALAVRQSAIPLNLPLSRVGARLVEGGNVFRIADVRVGGSEVPVSPLREPFAPAQFTEMSDAEKLSRASFEPLEAGIEVRGGDAPKSDFMRVVELAFEVIYIRKPRLDIRFFVSKVMADLLVMGSAAAASPLAKLLPRPSLVATPPVRVETEGFAVATVSEMRVHAGDLVFASQAEAVAARARLVADDPTLAHELQVLPSFELAA